MKTDGLYDVLAVGQNVVCDSPGKQRVTLEYGQAVPYALADTAFLGGFQPRLDFLNDFPEDLRSRCALRCCN